MVGGWGVWGRGAYLQKTISNLPSHTQLLVRFEYYAIESWDGERAQSALTTASFGTKQPVFKHWLTGPGGAFQPVRRWRSGQHVRHQWTITHSSSSVTLRFSSTLDEGAPATRLGACRMYAFGSTRQSPLRIRQPPPSAPSWPSLRARRPTATAASVDEHGASQLGSPARSARRPYNPSMVKLEIRSLPILLSCRSIRCADGYQESVATVLPDHGNSCQATNNHTACGGESQWSGRFMHGTTTLSASLQAQHRGATSANAGGTRYTYVDP